MMINIKEVQQLIFFVVVFFYIYVYIYCTVLLEHRCK